ncbi:2-hydroxyhepta-2,4-diene-1,7-dioate isomerase [Halenospora varia]|nr:2-hydroxyhepta-2,4-diene-1,7-dioate isomerase [Halenospora varia]
MFSFYHRKHPIRRCATAFEDNAVDLQVLEERELFQSVPGFKHGIFSHTNLNAFAALPSSSHLQVREILTAFLLTKSSHNRFQDAFISLSNVKNYFAMQTSNFSGFYCSLEHTKNCTEVFNIKSIPKNWFTIPTVYNGRTSSLVVSNAPITRPYGIVQPSPDSPPISTPTTQLDFELEMGVFLSAPVPRGERISVSESSRHIFSFVLLNDWSASDIQVFEMPPLGPFHSKGSGTSISPWIVTLEAMEAVHCPRSSVQSPSPLNHLEWKGSDDKATWDVEVEVKVIRKGDTFILGQSNLRELHWTPRQQLTHLASAGEGLTTGDIFGTGTISSDRVNEIDEKIGLGCILERKLQRNNLAYVKDISTTFLIGGDEVVMEGWCRSKMTGNWFGFGQCSGVVLPAAADGD